MNELLLKRAAAGVCIGMAAVLVLLQFVLTPATKAPTFLFVLFTLVWLFGATMLYVAPVFGGIGTALYGIISAAGAWRTHAVLSAENLVLILGSFVASALATAFLVARAKRA